MIAPAREKIPRDIGSHAVSRARSPIPSRDAEGEKKREKERKEGRSRRKGDERLETGDV